MRTNWRKQGWKLKHLLRKDRHLLRKIVNLRKQGESFAHIALYIYERTGEKVDPTAVREWLLKYKEEKDGGRDSENL